MFVCPTEARQERHATDSAMALSTGCSNYISYIWNWLLGSASPMQKFQGWRHFVRSGEEIWSSILGWGPLTIRDLTSEIKTAFACIYFYFVYKQFNEKYKHENKINMLSQKLLMQCNAIKPLIHPS